MILPRVATSFFIVAQMLYNMNCPNNHVDTSFHADIFFLCKEYYMCTNSTYLRYQCPAGQAFDESTQQCSGIINVPCNRTALLADRRPMREFNVASKFVKNEKFGNLL
ncbi:hypothetical protein NPIL_558051 [Nephila pilipes]|uniref:Chitin-binding type-2 domain-containing protein n=1 Tax=Nephila pilipes TaxID=299642 RepID=A0A8X6NVJ0_NEPPI|nr:hypothetical protein NPIL_558051 [Nephila pilipes]